MTAEKPVVQTLKDDLSKLMTEARRHRERAEQYLKQAERQEELAAEVEEQAEHFRSVLAFYEPRGPDAVASHADDGVAEQPQQKALKNEMWKVLADERAPLHYREIHRRVEANGFQVPGRDPARNVNAHLSVDPRFVNVGRGMWGLRSWGPATPPPPPLLVDPEDGASNSESEDGISPGHIVASDTVEPNVRHLVAMPRQDRAHWEQDQ